MHLYFFWFCLTFYLSSYYCQGSLFNIEISVLSHIFSFNIKGHPSWFLIRESDSNECYQSCLSMSALISPSFLRDNFTRDRIFSYECFYFSTLNVFLHCCLASIVSYEKLSVNLTRNLLYLMCWWSSYYSVMFLSLKFTV